MAAPVLPIPPTGTPIFDQNYQMAEVWRRYFLSLGNINGTFAPVDARYWLSTANVTLTNEEDLGLLSTGYLKVTVAAGTATPSSVASIPASDVAGSALTRVNDTNVTLALGGTPATALLKAASLTLGWTGLLSQARGGTGKDTSAATDGQLLIGKTSDGSLNLATLTPGTNITITNAAGAITISASSGGSFSLLHQGSGTDANTAATNLDTYALASQLTVKDTLFIVYELEQVTQNATATHQFYNNTDGVTAGSTFGASTMLAGQQGMGRCWISPLQSSSKTIGQVGQSVRFAVATGNDSNLATFTTDWTGAWTLALRSGGQTSGGTIRWKWAVYRVAGQ